MAGKTYEIDGREYRFNAMAFRQLLETLGGRTGKNVGECQQELADALFVSPATVKGWRFGTYSPASWEVVEQIAEHYGIGVGELVTEVHREEQVEEMNANAVVVPLEIQAGKAEQKTQSQEQYSERQLNALRCVYQSIMGFLEEFRETNGFGDYASHFVRRENPKYREETHRNKLNGNNEIQASEWILRLEGEGDSVEDAYRKADDLHKRMVREIHMQDFDLHDLSAYRALQDFATSDLPTIYSGRIYDVVLEAIKYDQEVWDECNRSNLAIFAESHKDEIEEAERKLGLEPDGLDIAERYDRLVAMQDGTKQTPPSGEEGLEKAPRTFDFSEIRIPDPNVNPYDLKYVIERWADASTPKPKSREYSDLSEGTPTEAYNNAVERLHKILRTYGL